MFEPEYNHISSKYYKNHLKLIEKCFENGIGTTNTIRNGLKLIFYNIKIHHHDHNKTEEKSNTILPSYSNQEEPCPLCHQQPSKLEPKQRQQRLQNENQDWIRHFLCECDFVIRNTKNEIEKLESQETEIILRLNGIDIRKICLIGDFLNNNLNHNQW